MKRIILLAGLVNAHKTVDEDVPDDVLLRGTDDFGDLDLSFIKNKNYEKEIVKFTLSHKFSDEQEITPRGDLVITKNKATNEIMKVDLQEQPSAKEGLESLLEEKCKKGAFYQLEVKELDLLTSMTACYYHENIGLNDTLSFQTDASGKNVVAMQVEYKDIKYLASLEKNPKKKRLMQERQYSVHNGLPILSKMYGGAKPEFTKNGYDSVGNEIKQTAQQRQTTSKISADGKEVEVPVEQEKTFFQKYWWHLMIGFLVMNSLGGQEPAGAQAGGGGRAAAPQRK